MLVSINEAYKNNADLKTYVDKFCKCHRTTPENAIKCVTVQEVYRSYSEGGINAK